jgi:leader peptidase (prepilin peptidase)/N-methyltransferase
LLLAPRNCGIFSLMILIIYSLIIGLLVGSFLNVCIWRLPRHESIISPGSHCPSCNRPVAFYDNIPVLSYLILGGRCRNCKARISWRYPLVELINGVGYAVLMWRYGLGWPALVYAVLFSALVVITFIDLDHQIIPDRITLPGIAIGLAAGSFILPNGLIEGAAGLLLGGGLFYLIAVLSRGGMGGGDIKMIAMVGAVLGWKAVLLTIFVGALSGSLVGLTLMLTRGKSRKTPVPFGPFLSLGTIVFLFWGPEIIAWYAAFSAGGF